MDKEDTEYDGIYGWSKKERDTWHQPNFRGRLHRKDCGDGRCSPYDPWYGWGCVCDLAKSGRTGTVCLWRGRYRVWLKGSERGIRSGDNRCGCQRRQGAPWIWDPSEKDQGLIPACGDSSNRHQQVQDEHFPGDQTGASAGFPAECERTGEI